MAEERALGLARAEDQSTEDLSKEELQRRMDVARDSISNTVSEIKETVANQVQAVKDTLDWREQFKRRPVAWAVGAMGVGFMLGYGIAGRLSAGDEEPIRDYEDYSRSDSRTYAAQPVLSSPQASMQPQSSSPEASENGHGEGSGPGFFTRLAHTPAYHRVRDEMGDIGSSLIQELTKTTKSMVIPALMTSLKNFLGQHLRDSERSGQQADAQMRGEAQRSQGSTPYGGYQPSLERNQS